MVKHLRTLPGLRWTLPRLTLDFAREAGVG